MICSGSCGWNVPISVHMSACSGLFFRFGEVAFDQPERRRCRRAGCRWRWACSNGRFLQEVKAGGIFILAKEVASKNFFIAPRIVLDVNHPASYRPGPPGNGTMRHVFVSSTSKGMEAVRVDIIHAIQLADGFEPVNMENFGLRADVPLTVCRGKVRESAVFLGIIGHDHGSCPPNSDVSYMRHEYNEALALGLPRLMFVTPNLADGTVLDPRQAAFRAQVLADGLAVMRHQGETHDFGRFTAAGLHNLPPETRSRRAQPTPAPRIFGREEEIGRIVTALTGPVMNPLPVAILGHAGIGKTTVTLGVLHHPAIRERYGAHRFFAALGTSADLETMRIAHRRRLWPRPAVGSVPARAGVFGRGGARAAGARQPGNPAGRRPARAVEDDRLSLAQVEGLALVVSRRGTEHPGGPDWMTLDPLPPMSAEASSELFLRWAPRIKPRRPEPRAAAG